MVNPKRTPALNARPETSGTSSDTGLAFARVLDELDCKRDAELVQVLVHGFSSGHVGVCLCDQNDNIRYVNKSFRAAFFPNFAGEPANFVEALAAAIKEGKGIKLESMPIDAFVPHVKERRTSGSSRYDFSVDLTDGSWWWVNDHRFSNGWILVVATDISSIKQEEFRLRDAHEKAEKALRTDFLTGIPNRRSGMERAEAAIEELRANRLPLTLAVLDIDRFKQINDTYGHEIGDGVLVHFALALRRYMNERDQVSRIGGEEFLVVFPETSPSRACSRLQRFMRHLPPFKPGPGLSPVHISFSAGVAAGHYTEDLKALLARADAALYSAKEHGRKRVEISTQVPSRSVVPHSNFPCA